MARTTTLYHTSPCPIDKIVKDGLFGDCLCFALKPYFMTATTKTYVYEIEIDEANVIDAGRLAYLDSEDYAELRSIISDVQRVCECDEEMAVDLLADDCNAHEWLLTQNDASEKSWNVQRLQGEAAKALGYRGIRTSDEQGSMYLIAMFDRERELVLTEKIR